MVATTNSCCLVLWAYDECKYIDVLVMAVNLIDTVHVINIVECWVASTGQHNM